jgi:4-amino-4-deoxy-L-arabinose transferase-like glycosyltransferase
MSVPLPIADVPPPTQTERRWLIVLLLIAAVLCLSVICSKPDSLAEDRDLYWGIAKRLAAGDGYVHPDFGHPTAYRPPLYPLMLAGIVLIGGGPKTLAVVQVGLSVATVWLTWRLGRKLGLNSLALLAAAFVAINPLLIQATALAMTETLCAFLLVAVLWNIAELGGSKRHWPLGVLIGLAVLCRPTVWAYATLLSAVIAVCCFRTTAMGKRWRMVEVVRGLFPIVVAFGLTIAPWVIRNWLVFDTPIVTTTHGGYTLFLGNNDEAYREEIAQPKGPWDSRAWQRSLEEELQRVGIAREDEIGRDGWMGTLAGLWIVQHPREFAESCWLRQKRFWNLFPGGTDAGSLPTIVQWGVAVFFLVELSAAAVGFWRLRRDEFLTWLPLVLLVISFAGLHLVYWSNLRMRAPVEPALALLAARAFTSRKEESRTATVRERPDVPSAAAP